MINNFWQTKNVFVTGGSGLIGSWLTQELVNRGANVICLIRDEVNSSNFKSLNLNKKVTLVKGEIENFDLILRTINEYEIDTIFHLAAQTIVTTANRSPRSTFETNIKGTWNILEAARQLNTKRTIIASSDKAYGTHEKLPYVEDAKLSGLHPYDVSKSCTDLLAQSYHKTYNLPVAITRCGNIFGGGDLNFSRIIPGTMRSLLNDEPPVIRSDGEFLRDYFYVKDAVNAYLLLAEKLCEPEVVGQAFNFGREEPISVLDLANMIIELSESTHKSVILNEAKNEIRIQYLSCEKARKILNWKPQYTLKQSLAETYEWYKKYFSEEPK
ncbi:NAD-dependent epimerase/dehydratase family protein [Candidatus Woesearchaeota archaeon]|jgi:CDP-glucose 4,6-dehydratase|nr:NAD-dependent epimerase/dehydratase family protein [Candidatus Woesearchaeota archaeon]